MKTDEGIERVRKAREKIAKKCDYDLHKLILYYQKEQRDSKSQRPSQKSSGHS